MMIVKKRSRLTKLNKSKKKLYAQSKRLDILTKKILLKLKNFNKKYLPRLYVSSKNNNIA